SPCRPGPSALCWDRERRRSTDETANFYLRPDNPPNRFSWHPINEQKKNRVLYVSSCVPLVVLAFPLPASSKHAINAGRRKGIHEVPDFRLGLVVLPEKRDHIEPRPLFQRPMTLQPRERRP